ncbi:hypothetical protein [Flavisphingomonas formosensis]|uniref:hypothetical protein n=1 Tax=Flavisphingomonas formosensis TaxID=861534 RepID=UPI0012FC5FDF|nr:hypothetical protein [Sphingomonas formosensis]
MNPWLETAMTKYGWIWIGLTVGLAAKYALLIKRGVQIRPWLLVADLLLLPLVALIAYSIVSKLGASGETAALITALATVGADRLVKLYTERFLRQVDALTIERSEQVHGKIRQEIQLGLSGENVIRDAAQGRLSDGPPIAPRHIINDDV